MNRPEYFSSPIAWVCLPLIALCLAIVWCYWTFVRPYNLIPSRRMEIGILRTIMGRYKKNIPFTSGILQVILKTSKAFLNEGCCLLWMFRPYLFIFNEDFIKVFSNEPAVTSKSRAYDFVNDVFGNGLIGSSEQVWKVHRKLLNPAFSSGQLQGKMTLLNENATKLVTKLQRIAESPTEEVEHLIKDCTFNIMAESILGVSLSDEKFGSKAEKYQQQLQKAFDFMLSRISRPWLHWKFLLPLFPRGKMYLKNISEMREFVSEVINEMIKIENAPIERDMNGERNRKSIGHILLKQHLVEGNFTMEDVLDHVTNFIAAGYDTTHWTLMWCFYTLGQHAEIQERLFNEIDSVVQGEDVSFQDLSNLKYLECVIKETLRLYSTVPIFGRKLSKRMQCGKYIIPKDTEIFFFTFLLHRNPTIYPDPEKFDPDRFSDNSAIRPWMFIPFAEGYRNCIGKKFGMMEIKVVLVHVLRKFKITSLNKIEDGDLDWKITLKTIKPLRMLLTNRK